jgi:hypothetical protein
MCVNSDIRDETSLPSSVSPSPSLTSSISESEEMIALKPVSFSSTLTSTPTSISSQLSPSKLIPTQTSSLELCFSTQSNNNSAEITADIVMPSPLRRTVSPLITSPIPDPSSHPKTTQTLNSITPTPILLPTQLIYDKQNQNNDENIISDLSFNPEDHLLSHPNHSKKEEKEDTNATSLSLHELNLSDEMDVDEQYHHWPLTEQYCDLRQEDTIMAESWEEKREKEREKYFYEEVYKRELGENPLAIQRKEKEAKELRDMEEMEESRESEWRQREEIERAKIEDERKQREEIERKQIEEENRFFEIQRKKEEELINTLKSGEFSNLKQFIEKENITFVDEKNAFVDENITNVNKNLNFKEKNYIEILSKPYYSFNSNLDIIRNKFITFICQLTLGFRLSEPNFEFCPNSISCLITSDCHLLTTIIHLLEVSPDPEDAFYRIMKSLFELTMKGGATSMDALEENMAVFFKSNFSDSLSSNLKFKLCELIRQYGLYSDFLFKIYPSRETDYMTGFILRLKCNASSCALNSISKSVLLHHLSHTLQIQILQKMLNSILQFDFVIEDCDNFFTFLSWVALNLQTPNRTCLAQLVTQANNKLHERKNRLCFCLLIQKLITDRIFYLRYFHSPQDYTPCFQSSNKQVVRVEPGGMNVISGTPLYGTRGNQSSKLYWENRESRGASSILNYRSSYASDRVGINHSGISSTSREKQNNSSSHTSEGGMTIFSNTLPQCFTSNHRKKHLPRSSSNEPLDQHGYSGNRIPSSSVDPISLSNDSRVVKQSRDESPSFWSCFGDVTHKTTFTPSNLNFLQYELNSNSVRFVAIEKENKNILRVVWFGQKDGLYLNHPENPNQVLNILKNYEKRFDVQKEVRNGIEFQLWNCHF